MHLDGLLGLGSRSGLNAPLKVLTREINALRLKSNATVYAVDLPTGLGEEGVDQDAVVAEERPDLLGLRCQSGGRLPSLEPYFPADGRCMLREPLWHSVQ